MGKDKFCHEFACNENRIGLLMEMIFHKGHRSFRLASDGIPCVSLDQYRFSHRFHKGVAYFFFHVYHPNEFDDFSCSNF